MLVQVHDIFLPFDYPRDAVLNKLWFWSEQYLLQAFLAFNREVEVQWSASALQDCYPRVLEDCSPAWKHSYRNMPEGKRHFLPTLDGDRVWPSSFWMCRLPAEEAGSRSRAAAKKNRSPTGPLANFQHSCA